MVSESGPTSWAQRLLLLTLGTVVGLVLAEGVVRLAGIAPEVVLVQEGRYRLSPNPKIGYEPVPDFEFQGTPDSFRDYLGTSNSLGYRDREHPLAKPEGTRRIVLLGDSVAAGQGVRRMENAFPARVETGLLQAGLPIELLNFAVSGYNTQQEVWTLHDKGLAFDPDLVLVSFCLNDRKRSDGGILPTLTARAQGTSGVTRSRSDPRLMRSALYRTVRYRLLHPPEKQTIAPGLSGDSVDAAMEMLAELRDEHGFQVLVVVFPRFGKLLDYRWSAEHESITEVAEGHGFAVFDLLPAFQECRRTEDGRLASDSYHPTPQGHRCAADALERYLFDNSGRLGLLP